MKIDLRTKLINMIDGTCMKTRAVDDLNLHIGKKVLSLIGPECKKKIENEIKIIADKDLTIKDVFLNVLYAQFPDEKNPQAPKKVSPDEKMSKHLLISKIAEAKKKGKITIDLTEGTLLKNLIGEAYDNPSIMGQAWDIIEGKNPIEAIPDEEPDNKDKPEQEPIKEKAEDSEPDKEEENEETVN